MNVPTRRDRGIRIYTGVWLGLLLLTWVTVTVARMHHGSWSVVSAIVIAGFKSSLVLLFFMHLKDEKAGFRLMFLVTVILLVIIIGMTFLDIAYRQVAG